MKQHDIDQNGGSDGSDGEIEVMPSGTRADAPDDVPTVGTSMSKFIDSYLASCTILVLMQEVTRPSRCC